MRIPGRYGRRPCSRGFFPRVVRSQCPRFRVARSDGYTLRVTSPRRWCKHAARNIAAALVQTRCACGAVTDLGTRSASCAVTAEGRVAAGSPRADLTHPSQSAEADLVPFEAATSVAGHLPRAKATRSAYVLRREKRRLHAARNLARVPVCDGIPPPPCPRPPRGRGNRIARRSIITPTFPRREKRRLHAARNIAAAVVQARCA